MTSQLKRQLTRYFGVPYPGLTTRQLEDRIDPGSLVRYGRFRIAGDGDRMRTASLIDHNAGARDNSFVKVRI
jgi:hypothetical protein